MNFINGKFESNDKERMEAKVDFYKNAFMLKNGFKDNTAQIFNSGQDTLRKLIPRYVQKQLLLEPLSENSLKGYITVTNEHGLEVPMLSAMIKDSYSIHDDEVIKEIEAIGNLVSFGRYRDSLSLCISEAIYFENDTEFVKDIEKQLRAVNEQFEIETLFDNSSEVQETYKHMSIYNCGIKEVEGDNIYEALKAAIQGLPKAIRNKAKIVINSKDYTTLIELLATKGINTIPFRNEIVLEECCVNPIVGDLSFIHINYDGEVHYETTKSVLDGLWYFVLSPYRDIQIKLKSAFRIVNINSI